MEVHEIPPVNEVVKQKLRPDELYFAFADYVPPGDKLFFIQSKLLKSMLAIKRF